MEISIKWNVCRVCLQEETAKTNRDDSACVQMRNIFNDAKLAKQIYDCSGVLMQQNDSLPERICKNCLSVLRYAVNFRTTCRNSDEYLQTVIQKTKSATSMFKLDKRREETLELVDDVIVEMYEEVEKDAQAETHEDNTSEKRRRISNTLRSSTKKTKVDEKSETIEQQHVTMLENVPIRISSARVTHEETKVARKSTDELLHDLVGEETKEEVSEADDVEEDDDVEDAVEEDEENPLLLPTDMSAVDVKNETISQASSECSIEDAFIEVDDEPENVEAQDAKLSAQQLDAFDDNSADIKPLKIDINSNSNENEEQSPEINLHEAEEFFYLVSDIKQEYHGDFVDVAEQTQFIDLDDEATQSDSNVIAVENVEYLLDSAEEHSQAESACISVADTSKQRGYQRKGGGDLRVYVCDICGNHFTNRNLLNFHMKIHRNEKNFECELCFKRFNAACNLSAHMRIHTGEKPFECQFCNRRFADRSTHIKHERIHTNERPYSCTVCGKSFSLSTSLRAHERIHTGEKPFKCVPCAKSFVLPHQLKAHLNTHLHKLLAVEQ